MLLHPPKPRRRGPVLVEGLEELGRREEEWQCREAAENVAPGDWAALFGRCRLSGRSRPSLSSRFRRRPFSFSSDTPLAELSPAPPCTRPGRGARACVWSDSGGRPLRPDREAEISSKAKQSPPPLDRRQHTPGIGTPVLSFLPDRGARLPSSPRPSIPGRRASTAL